MCECEFPQHCRVCRPVTSSAVQVAWEACLDSWEDLQAASFRGRASVARKALAGRLLRLVVVLEGEPSDSSASRSPGLRLVEQPGRSSRDPSSGQ